MGLNYNSQPGTGEQKHLTEKEVDLHIVFKILKFSGQKKKKTSLKAQEYLMPCALPILCFFRAIL